MQNDKPTPEELADEVAEIKVEMGIPEGVDPITALLNVEQRLDAIREPIPVPLLDGTVATFIFKPVDDDVINEAQDRCTRFVKRGRGARVPEVDSQRMSRLLIAASCVSPNWNDTRLWSKYGGTDADSTIKNALLPGTVDGLGNKIMEITGYTDDLVAAGKS